MALFPHLPFDPCETHLSYAARLAAYHTGRRVVPFLHDLRSKPADFARGQREAVLKFCDHAAVDPAQMIANTAISTGKAHYMLRDEAISADFLSNPATVFCPGCLLDDDRGGDDPALVRIGRFEWTLRVVRTCPVHEIPLLHRPRGTWMDQLHEMAVRVPERGEALHALVAEAVQRPVSPLQSYATRRLEGVAGPGWLDGQTLEQAVRTTEMLGALVAFGGSRQVCNLGPDDWDKAGREGYAITSRGEAGIREALFEVQADFRKAGRQPLHRNVFGRFFEWLASDKLAKDPGDIRRIVREHLFDTVEIPAGEILLGGTLPERRLHSVASLARETALHPTTLRHVLIARKLITPDKHYQTFDAAAGRQVAASVQTMVHVISLPKALNCTRPQACGLLDEQVLMPIAVGPGGAPGRTQKAVNERNIQEFLAVLSKSGRKADTVPVGQVPIAKAAEKAKVSGVDIMHLVLGGYLSNVVILSSLEGVAAMHVDPAEVGAMAVAHMIGLSPSAVASRLRLPPRTIWALLEDREGGAFLSSSIVRGPNGLHSFRRIAPETADAFGDIYVNAVQIAERLQVRRTELERELRSNRITPAISAADVGVDL